MATWSQWLLLTYLGFSAAWMDERPVLESRDGNLFISAARDRNITLKILGAGYINVNEINLLHVASAAQNATHLIERLRTGYLTNLATDLQRLSLIVEGPDGLERRVATFKGLVEMNSTLPGNTLHNQSSASVNLGVRVLTNRVRRLEDKVRSIATKLRNNECNSNPCQNGGSCQDLYEGYQCNCPPNWEGPNCMSDVNECARLLGTDLGCQNGATCVNYPGSYRCECAPGWHGIHCTTKTSVCNTQNSEELCGHGVCVSKSGSILGYTCICDQGWQADGTNPACIKDVDECAGNHRPCSVNPWVACRNAPGTFFCDACPRGYTGNGYYCTDIDECLVDNGGCSTAPRVECINTMGSRMCGSCPSGYNGDGVTCVYVGGCKQNPCHPLATCIENAALTSAYVMCRCPAGFAGDGFGLNGCYRTATNVSVHGACSSNPCVHGNCVSGDSGSYICACDAGYIGRNCNIKDPCEPNPCKNNGSCSNMDGAAICNCPSTHTGPKCETPRQTCGGVTRNLAGQLVFPSDGFVYQHDLSCAWLLTTNSLLVLNVTFTKFNIEQSTDCKYDFLQIHDGRNAGSQMIGRFCGNTLPNGTGNIISTHNSLYFWFHSDSSISHDGFAFHWESIEPICGGALTADYGTISSPGSPGRYPPNRDCYWQILVQPSKRIQLHFGQLMLEEHPTCENDYLEITSETHERVGLYCNHTRPPPLIVPGSEAVLHFHSDSAGQDSGFQIHYSAIEGIPGCNAVYTHHVGTITPPTYMNAYHENMQCDWRIQMPVGERIQITWSKFDLEISTECLSDYVEIYDGPTSESPLLGRFCGSTLPPTLKSNSNVLLVVFRSDRSLQKEGFTLSYTILCGGVFTESNGTLHSPMYPGTYHSSRVCLYEIVQPPGKRIMLNILDMEIEGLNPDDCYFDYLEIYDGDNENSTKLATLCGDETNKPPDPYYSTHNYMLLKFVSDGSIEDRGFNANYTTIDSKCGGLFKDPTGIINSPAQDDSYDEDCVWTIQAPPGNIVQLSFLSFQLEKTYRCSSFVKVYENYLSSDMDLHGTFCGTRKPPIITSQSNRMSIVWHIDNYPSVSSDHNAFVASYLFMDASKVCGGHYMKPNGVIKSPNHPRRYPSRRECVWLVEAENRHRVILNVQSFDVEFHRSCIYDYLEIRNGGYETSPLIGKFCGTEIPSQIISQTNLLYLKFVSDASRQYDGFSIAWDSTTTGCGGNMNAATGDIISPNYPQPYTHANCNWKISVAAGSLVRLLIVDLDLEHHEKCRFDYIEIFEDIDPNNRQRFCGTRYPKVIQAKSNVINVKFRADYSNFGRGFHLKYETLCQNKLHGFYGAIESPNFPEKSEEFLNCSWVIDAPLGNKVNLTFSHFELEGLPERDSTCQNYLDIREGMDDAPNTQLKKLCSTDSVPHQTISSTQHQVFVRYMASSPTPVSFRLEWLLDGCGGHLTRPFDTFTSPGYPSSYPLNVECEWLIEVDYMTSVELTFHDINTEKQKGCYFDKVQVYSGDSSNAPMLIEICHSEKPVVYTSFGNKMFVKFHSDMSYASRGFNASYKSVPVLCGGRFTADAGTIYSTNYPQNYPHKQNCEWLLQVPPNYRVNLTFADFDLERSANCSDDHVKIYDGPTRDSPLLATLCRNELPEPFVSTGNEMLVVMKTDSIISAKGFKAMYSTACGARLEVKDVGYITPSWIHADNEDEENCTWTLIAENPEDHVTLSFTRMELALDVRYGYTGEDCSMTFVEVHEGPSIDGPSLGKWCNNVVPLPVTSSGDALTVHMSAPYSLNAHFAITYSVLNSACGGTYASYSGKIASPLYPNSYPLNSECVWTMQNSPGNKLKLTFSEFDLQQSDNCDLDYLEIRENNGIGKLLGVFCGNTAESIESSASIWMKFKSGGEGVGKGFVADYTFEGGNELTGPTGRITSPMYPLPTKLGGVTSWRITVEFQQLIRIEIKDVFIENFGSGCYSYLRVYDGYNEEAPVLLESCKMENPEPVTTSSNVAYIQFLTELIRLGSWFDLTWIQVPMDKNGMDTDTQLSNCTELITLKTNEALEVHSPGWPNGYDDNLQCTWVFTSAPGWHIVLRLVILDVEEVAGCGADSLSVYDGDALNAPESAKLLERMCYSNSSYTELRATDNVMTVKFESDGYINKTGFNAFVRRDCGGKLYGPNGEIVVDPTVTSRGFRSWKVLCEWIVQVKPGRTIEVKVTEFPTDPDLNCDENYLLLKNGDESTSYLLGDGNYCANNTPPTLVTTGNRLYVKYVGVAPKARLKLLYREIGMNCGGAYVLNGKEMEISSPNYPNIPPPYSECKWSVMVPSKERISIHFVERFDLSNSLNCEREYVEVRDGGTQSSKLLGRFCKDVAPSSLSTTGNMVYIHFYSDLPEPKNGFKAKIATGEVCGGIIRGSGVISSPDYPFFYKKNLTCTWTIIAPVDHTLQLELRDIDLPHSYNCATTDHVTISERSPENETSVNELLVACGDQKKTIETSSNEAVVEFKSDSFDYHTYRGFSMNFSSSAGVCGGFLTATSGTIKPYGYPSVAARARYCDWKIMLPLGFQVTLDIEDFDMPPRTGPRRRGSLSFYNDLKLWSEIKSVAQNNTQQQIKSSSNTMSILYISAPGYRGFKARYYATIPSPCGGLVKNVKGNLTAPAERPFNESSYYCEWRIEAPDSMANNMSDSGVTLSIWANGLIGGIRGLFNWKVCYSFQYISLVDYGMICGNFTEPKYLRSSNPVNDVVVVNGTRGEPMKFNLQYEWQPCGGTLEGPTHIVETPKNIPFPISCAWKVNYPDTGELIKLSFLKMNLGPCEKSYIGIRNGGPVAPLIGTYCGNIKPENITSSGNRLWIEYFAKSEPNEFKLILESANNGCGGAVRGKNKQIASPKFPNQYPNNIECSWEITADNGYHVGLVFTNRFNLEGGKNCTNDYVEVFDWIEKPGGNSTWKSLGRVCGRDTPPSFNSTSKRMKVIFHSNDKIQGDGFTALWYENCGGVIEVTSKTQIITSPSYPNLYKPNLFCNYTLVAPGRDIIVRFTEFQLEHNRRNCRFDNVTILSDSVGYYGSSEEIYCGEEKPLPVISREKVEIVFKTDSYIQRTGFVFQYFLKTCGGKMTEPGAIEPLMRGDKYFGGVTCSWTITAPPDKNVVLRFEKFVLEHSQSCYFDWLDVYDGPEMNSEKRLSRLCGNLTANLPTIRSTNNSMHVYFNSDTNRESEGFKAKVLFVKRMEAGCGGQLSLISKQKLQFKTQNGATYDSLEDCHWVVDAPPGKNIKFTIDSMDLKNATNKTSSKEACTGDYIEVRDGSSPFAELLGKYCGNRVPSPIFTASDKMWIRFVSDSNLEGTGVSGTLETVDAFCGIPTWTVSETMQILTSPNYPNSYGTGAKCRWLLRTASTETEKMRIQFLDVDLAESARCETDYVEIMDKQNRKYIEEGFGQNFIWSGHDTNQYSDFHAPTTSIKYCGKELPHEYYSYSSEVLVTFKGDSVGHKGFKLQFNNATCSRNYTSEQGRIVHEGTNECWNTITAPVNHTISLYFQRILFYDPEQCTRTAIEIYEGGFNGTLLAKLCGTETPPPIFSVGNKLSIHSWSEWKSMYEFYDISFTTTDAGRGCGGRIYNYAGTFTSPLYPNEYRKNTVCTWDVSVPRGLKVLLKFSVFDIGSGTGCENKANTLKLYEPAPDEERILANTYCGGDDPAPFFANGERILVEYTSTMNNVGTGWVINFKGVQEGETA